MPTPQPTLDEVRKLAADLGLDRLTEEHLAALTRATAAARARRSTMPLADIVPADEPAHVFQIIGGNAP